MLKDRTLRTVSDRDVYTNVQQRKRIRCTKTHDGKMSDEQCISLVPSASDNPEQSPSRSPWKGWKTLSNESSSNAAKENLEFPSLTNSLFDSWFTPEPIKNWADFMDDEEARENMKQINVNKKQRFRRKLLLTENREKRAHEKKTLKPILMDEHRLSQRQKQIDFGKNTVAYGRYISETPRHCRQLGDPRTPDKFQICSTRSWTGQVKSWRRKLHEWDPPTEGRVDLFSSSFKSNNLEDVQMDSEQNGSTASSNSNEDFFKDLNIDECLLKEHLPL